MIRAFSRFDTEKLSKIAESRAEDPLPRYLRFLTLLRSSGVLYDPDKTFRNEIIAAGRAVLENVPDCFRVYDGMASTQGVANLHSSTSIPLELSVKVLPKRVGAIPGLPKSAAERISDGLVDEVGLRNRLVAAAADDTSDLTWSVLARQLREIRDHSRVGRHGPPTPCQAVRESNSRVG